MRLCTICEVRYQLIHASLGFCYSCCGFGVVVSLRKKVSKGEVTEKIFKNEEKLVKMLEEIEWLEISVFNKEI